MSFKGIMTGLLGLFLLTGSAHAGGCSNDKTPKKIVVTLTDATIQNAGFGLAVANAMQEAGVEATVFVASDAVKYVYKAGEQPKFIDATPREMMASLMKKGGTVMVCGGFVQGVKPSELVEGVAVAKPADLAGALYAPNTQAMSF